jgi:hypothetical protein
LENVSVRLIFNLVTEATQRVFKIAPTFGIAIHSEHVGVLLNKNYSAFSVGMSVGLLWRRPSQNCKNIVAKANAIMVFIFPRHKPACRQAGIGAI